MAKSSIEIKKEIETKRTVLEGQIEQRDAAGAEATMKEIADLKKLLPGAMLLEQEEKRSLSTQVSRKAAGDLELRSAVKYAMGRDLSEEERAAVNLENNAAILPEQFINDIQILKDGFPALKGYCHKIRVTSNHGKMPFAKIGGKKLTKFKSGTKLTGEAANTEDVSFDIENYGTLVPIANDLQEDEAVNIVNEVIKPDFSEASVNTENEEILAIVVANQKKVTSAAGNTYKTVEETIDSTLPSVRKRVITITNVVGQVYLKKQKDEIGRDLKLVTAANGKEYFHDHELVTLDNEAFTDVPAGTAVFFVVDLFGLVKFFERRGYTLATDKSVFFESEETALKVTERFDTVALDTRTDKRIEITDASDLTEE